MPQDEEEIYLPLVGHHIQEENEVPIIQEENQKEEIYLPMAGQHIQKERALVFPRENDLVIRKGNFELHHELQETRKMYPEKRRTTHQEKILEIHPRMRVRKHLGQKKSFERKNHLEREKMYPEEKRTIHLD